MMAATLVGFTGTVLPQETVEPPLPVPSLWDTATTVRVGGGYKDNVFLSSTQPEGAPFVSAEAEFIALRIALEGPELTIFSSADAHHYFTSGSGHNEYTAFAQAELAQEFSSRFKGSLSGLYFYQDQVLDVSASEQVPESMQVVGHTLGLRPGGHVDLGGNFWVGVETAGLRQFFENPLDDYWEAGAKVALGRSYGTKSEVVLSYEPTWRFYDTEQALDSSGAAIPGTSRERFRHDARLAWRHSWDAARKWRTTLGGGYQVADENGAGYFDYSRWQLAGKLEYRPGPWRFSVDARFSDYDYANQPANEGSTATRQRTEYAVAGRIERTLYKQLRAVIYGEHSQTLSNAELEDYSVNTVGALLEWEF